MISQIKVQDITKSYNGISVLRGLSLTIDSKQVYAIIGPNGVGKTTAIEIILAMRDKDGGEIEYVNVGKYELGVQLQNAPLFPVLTVKENIEMFSAFYGQNIEENRLKEILDTFELWEVRSKTAMQLSGGQKKRLSIALAMLHQPKILFLDEPTSDLDPKGRIQIRSLIRKLADQGCSVVITSHDMDEVAKTADKVFFINEGKVIEEGIPSSIMEKYNVTSMDEVYMILSENSQEDII